MSHYNFFNQLSRAVDTPDATPVVLTNIVPPVNSCAVIEHVIIGRGVTSGDMNVYIIRYAFKVDGVGNVTAPFVQDKIWVKEENAGWDANLSVVGGTSIQCEVTGDAAETVRWTGRCQSTVQIPT